MFSFGIFKLLIILQSKELKKKFLKNVSFFGQPVLKSLFKDMNFSLVVHNTRTKSCKIKNQRQLASLRFSAIKKTYSELERDDVTLYFGVEHRQAYIRPLCTYGETAGTIMPLQER
jgi:hypothetical protein